MADCGVYSSHGSHMEKWLTGTRMYLFSGSLSPDRLSLLKNLQRATSHLALLFCREATTTRFHFLEVETKLKQAIGLRAALRKATAVNVQENKHFVQCNLKASTLHETSANDFHQNRWTEVSGCNNRAVSCHAHFSRTKQNVFESPPPLINTKTRVWRPLLLRLLFDHKYQLQWLFYYFQGEITSCKYIFW